VADSVYEAEYIASPDVEKEAVWLRMFFGELGVAPSLDSPISMYYDSTGAIAQAKEPKSHQRTKHILHRYHLVQEIIKHGNIELLKIDGKENLADPFIKAVGMQEFNKYK